VLLVGGLFAAGCVGDSDTSASVVAEEFDESPARTESAGTESAGTESAGTALAGTALAGTVPAEPAGTEPSSTAPAEPAGTEPSSTEPAIDDPQPVNPELRDGGPLELIFRDEFDTGSLADVWTTCYWWQLDGGCTIAGNDEQQWYQPDAVAVGVDGLELTVRREEQRTSEGDRLPYTSGMVSTGHVDSKVEDFGFAFTYGIVEARIRLPEGAGLWPAVWLLSADRTSRPEIDAMEWYGSRPDETTSHVHATVDGEAQSEGIDYTFDRSLAGAWHEIAVDWSAERVAFYFDGVEIGRVDDDALVPDSPMYLIMNLAAGGLAGDVDESALPQSMLVDYIRVWQEIGT
jgi:beta-glucanase (GH16 family)